MPYVDSESSSPVALCAECISQRVTFDSATLNLVNMLAFTVDGWEFVWGQLLPPDQIAAVIQRASERLSTRNHEWEGRDEA